MADNGYHLPSLSIALPRLEPVVDQVSAVTLRLALALPASLSCAGVKLISSKAWIGNDQLWSSSRDWKMPRVQQLTNKIHQQWVNNRLIGKYTMIFPQ